MERSLHGWLPSLMVWRSANHCVAELKEDEAEAQAVEVAEGEEEEEDEEEAEMIGVGVAPESRTRANTFFFCTQCERTASKPSSSTHTASPMPAPVL